MKPIIRLLLALIVVYYYIPTAFSAPKITISSAYYSGDVDSYFAAWSACSNKTKSLKRGEYESKAEFKNRKARMTENCAGFENVTIETPWELHYNPDRQRFIIKLTDAFRGLLINGLVSAIGGENGPSDCFSAPIHCQGQWNIDMWYICSVTVYADCIKPQFRLSSMVRRIDIDAKCNAVYTRDFNTCWRKTRYEIRYNKIAIYIPLEEARKLKSHERSLFIELSGKLHQDPHSVNVTSFRIVDRANNHVIAIWSK